MVSWVDNYNTATLRDLKATYDTFIHTHLLQYSNMFIDLLRVNFCLMYQHS